MTGRRAMTTGDEPRDGGRRDFIKLAAAGAPLAAVAAVSGGEAQAAQAAEPKAGLRKTAHVEAYLKSARF